MLAIYIDPKKHYPNNGQFFEAQARKILLLKKERHTTTYKKKLLVIHSHCLSTGSRKIDFYIAATRSLERDHI